MRLNLLRLENKSVAYPASTKTLAVWLAEIDQKASLLKSQAEQQHAFSNAGQLNMDMIRRFYDLLKSVHVFFTTVAQVDGIAAYATNEKQDEVANPVAEFQAMQAAIANTISWLNSNVPQGAFGGSNYKLGFVFPADNVTPSSSLTFTAVQTAGYRTVLAALINTIG